MTRLKLGDYLLDNRFLFERKILVDLVTSIISGRLFSQALRLAAAPLRPAMTLEGTSVHLVDSGISWEAIQSALIAVSLFCGVPLLRTRTPGETVRTMLYAAREAGATALHTPGFSWHRSRACAAAGAFWQR